MERQPLGSRFFIKDYLVDVGSGCLSLGEDTQRLEPKAMMVLLVLAEAAGDTVGKEALMASVWPDTHVEDNAVSRAVSQLRKAFGDQPRQPEFIITVPKVGYRLIQPVRAYEPALRESDSQPKKDQRPDTLVSFSAEESLPIDEPESSAVESAPAGTDRATVLHPDKPAHKIPMWSAIVVLLVVGLIWVASAYREQGRLLEAGNAPVQRVAVTSMPGVESAPTVGKQGQLAFVHRGKGTGARVMTLDDAGSPVPLVPSLPGIQTAPAWSPDGRRCAFFQIHDGLRSVYVWESGQSTRLVGCNLAASESLSWSADGKQLAFSQKPGPDRPIQVHLIDVKSARVTALWEPDPHTIGDMSPQFSPDGRYLAFIRQVDNLGGDIHITHLPDGQPQRLTQDHTHIAGIGWQPDSNRLWFSSGREDVYRLWSIAAGGGEPRWESRVQAYDPGKPRFDHENGDLIYEEWLFDFDIRAYRMTEDGDVEADLSLTPPSATRWDFCPAASSDGNRAVFVSNRQGSRKIWLVDTDGTRLLQPAPPGIADQPAWSPDGTRVAYQVEKDGDTSLYVTDLEKGTFFRVTDAAADDRRPNWSEDGHSLLFRSERDGGIGIYRVAIEGGTPEMVLAGHYWSAREAAGKLYYCKQGRRGLYVRENGEEQRFIEDLHPDDWADWWLEGEAVWYVKRSTDGFQLVRREGAVSKVLPLPDGVFTRVTGRPSLALVPGKRIFWATHVVTSEADLVRVPGLLLPGTGVARLLH